MILRYACQWKYGSSGSMAPPVAAYRSILPGPSSTRNAVREDALLYGYFESHCRVFGFVPQSDLTCVQHPVASLPAPASAGQVPQWNAAAFRDHGPDSPLDDPGPSIAANHQPVSGDEPP